MRLWPSFSYTYSQNALESTASFASRFAASSLRYSRTCASQRSVAARGVRERPRRKPMAEEKTHHHRNVGFSIINLILGLVGR